MLIAIAIDDAYYLGVLSSRIHVVWALAAGGRLGVGNDPRYNKTRCLQTFPFPAATEAQQARIRELAERLDTHRRARQAEHPGLTMTGMYNVLEKLRSAGFQCSTGFQPMTRSAGFQPMTRSTGFQPITPPTTTPNREPDAQILKPHGLEARATLEACTTPEDLTTPEPFDPRSVHKRNGLHLPHWTQDGVAYAITFRLADSLPQEIAEQWRAERERLLAEAEKAPSAEKSRLQQHIKAQFSERFLQLLDAGHGACHFNNPEAAKIVADALQYFDGDRYTLYAWCVMPNHVHIVFLPLGGHEPEDILHSWKSYTSTKVNRAVKRKGQLWQGESFDHIIRNQDDFDHSVQYTLDNPKNAGLKDWPWVGCSAGFQPMTCSAGFQPMTCSTGFQPMTPPAATPNCAPEARGLQPHGLEARATLEARVTVEARTTLEARATLTAKEREIHEQGLVSILKEIHDALDAAVFEAYGWPHDLTDEEILERLVALNAERAEEERQGHVRWLRPDFQCKQAQPTETAALLGTEADEPGGAAATKRRDAASTEKRPWPATLAAQAQAIREVLASLNKPATAQEIAKAFQRARKERVSEILETLVSNCKNLRYNVSSGQEGLHHAQTNTNPDMQ